VAHHGSKTSTAPNFLDATQPQFAIISSGTGNLYRHPNRQVLDGLEQHHTAILRTDQAGLITLRTNGRRFTMDTARWNETSPRVESAF
jgi:competence protein ComEC